MKVLVTSGATREPIDGVRFLTNFSSGRTGCVIANCLVEAGHSVVYLHGVGAAVPNNVSKSYEFVSFVDLDVSLQKLLSTGEFDAVIHLSAVGDFSLDKIELSDGSFATDVGNKKLDSSQNIKLHLRRNHKILSRLKSYVGSGKPLFVVGFKLTNFVTESQIKEKLQKVWQAGGVDLLVHNDKSEITEKGHLSKIYDKDGLLLAQTCTKEALARALSKILQER